MSLLCSRVASTSGPSGSLCTLLALLLLTSPAPLASAGPSSVITRELRCVCLNIIPMIHPKMISNLEMFASGPRCPNVELIATLKNGQQACLDPKAPLIKKIIHKFLDSGKPKN